MSRIRGEVTKVTQLEQTNLTRSPSGIMIIGKDSITGSPVTVGTTELTVTVPSGVAVNFYIENVDANEFLFFRFVNTGPYIELAPGQNYGDTVETSQFLLTSGTAVTTTCAYQMKIGYSASLVATS